ncbi:MAG: ABC transporter ATP-binding protein/permease [Bifidobacteriaceae bacterium]|jgi:ATP-binding cassette subfamily B protein|nr:ABC transporter ATP-binding protein/permease [Bifidobacteriaceae bacterium]
MLMRLLRSYLRPYLQPICLVVVFQAVNAVANLYLPTLNADIIDNGVAKGDSDYILRIGAIMLAVALAQGVCAIAATYFGARTAMQFGRDLRQAVFDRVETFSGREVARFGAPSLITRTTNDVQQVQMLVMMTLIFLIYAPLVAIGGVIMALRHDVALSGLLLVIVPVLGVFMGLVIQRMAPLFRQMQDTTDSVNRVMREQITGVRVVRAFVRDHFERERFEGVNSHLKDLQIRIGRLFVLVFPGVMLVMNVSSVAVMWFGGHRIAGGDMEVGGLTAFLTYLIQILMAVMFAAMMFFFLPRAQVSAERVTAVLKTESSVVEAVDAATELPQSGELAMVGASFRYPKAEEPVLKDITFTAHPGQTLAIIGATGSGKSTLLKLIPRLFDATEGVVQVGGLDVREISLSTLWSQIGLVPQRPYLFSGSIASNLRFGADQASDDELWQALEVAQARDFVAALENGLDAEVAQGGTNFSGGQRQRLAIARALVRKPPIFLFDDSFSALDFATDASLRAALKPVTRHSTVVIVAQRVSTIMDADQILVLEAGRIVGAGKHQELMTSCQTYSEIVLSQLSAEEVAA